jgi:long-chain acyl-CoA synthetase
MRTRTPVSSAAARSAAILGRVLDVVLADLGLSLPQYRLLSYLSAGAAGASPAARELATSRPSITALVDGVVAKGLVDRRPDTDDRRRVALTLTADGAALLEQADQAVTRRLEELAANLPAAEASRAFEGLGFWLKAIRIEVEGKTKDGS